MRYRNFGLLVCAISATLPSNVLSFYHTQWCTGSCVLNIRDDGERQELYIKDPTTLRFANVNYTFEYEMFAPLLEMRRCEDDSEALKRSINDMHSNILYQTFEVPIAPIVVQGPSNTDVVANISHECATKNLLVRVYGVSESLRLRAMWLLMLPTAQIRVHGSYFNRQPSFFVLSIVPTVMAIGFVISYRTSLVESAFAFAWAAFFTVALENVYQVLHAMRHASLGSDDALPTLFVGAFPNLLLAFACVVAIMLPARYMFHYTFFTSVVALVAFVCLGVGWYVGPLLLLLASLGRCCTFRRIAV